MKRNLWKRTVSLLMSVVMLMSLVVVPAQAEGTGAPADAAGAPVQASQQEAPAAAAAAGTVTGGFVEIVTECPEGVSVEAPGDVELPVVEGLTFDLLKSEAETNENLNPFAVVKHEGQTKFLSTNKNFNSHYSLMTVEAREFCSVTFQYSVSSEQRYDGFCYDIDNPDLNKDDCAEFFSGEESGTITLTLDKGQKIYLCYLKDGSADGGEDQLLLWDFTCTKAEGRKLTVEYDSTGGIVRLGGKTIMPGTVKNVLLGTECQLEAAGLGGFEGWYKGVEFVSNESIVTVSMENNTTLTAKFKPIDLTGTGLRSIAVFPEYIWMKQDDGSFVSGNARIESSVSNLMVEAATDGLLMFQYKTSSEGNCDCLYYSKSGPISTENYEQADNYGSRADFSGEHGWTDAKIPVSTGDKVYFAYRKDPTEGRGEDCVWLRNLKIVGGIATVTATASNPLYGDVSGTTGELSIGSTITLTATPKEGCAFYGWFDSEGQLLSRKLVYTCTAISNLSLTAKFDKAKENFTAWNVNKGELGELAAVAEAACSGDIVLLLKDTTVSADTVVPEGVTLVVPFSASDETGYQMGTTACTRPTIATREAFRKLTIAPDKTLTVNGTLIVGGVQHAPDQHAQGQTSGDYAEIICNGTVQVANSGALTVYGKITGSGTTRVANGATVKIPYLVTDYAGGNNTDALYGAKSFPFGQYATINVQNTMVVEGGASVVGMTSLFFWRSIHQQNIDLIGTASGLIYLPVGSTLTATYDADKAVKTTVGNIDLQDFGKTTLTISGGATGGKFDLSGYGSTGMYLNIPYTYDLVLKNGSYQMANLYRIMPGAAVTVAENATLNVSGGLQVADGWQQADKSGKSYPSSGVLATNGFSQSGSLLVNGTLNINGTFGGVAQTTGGGVITTGADAKLNESFTSGSTDGYTDNLVSYSLPARIMVGDTLTQMKTGAEYRAVSTETWTLPSYTMEANRITTGNTVTINQLMRGKWSGKVTLTFEGCNPITAFPGEAITLPAPTKTGYTFAGWYNGETKFEAKVMPRENLALIAKWTPSTNTAYTVEHYWQNLADDGYTRHETENKTGTTGSATAAAAKSYPGFTAGTVTQTTIAADGSTVVRINYTRNSYKLTWNFDGGKENATGYTSGTVKFGADITKPAAPTKTGYTFGGWDKTIPESMPAGDMTVKAQWKINQYTITFDTDGGSEVASITQDYGTTIAKPTDPTKTGYTFAGWSEKIPETMPAENVTVKAQWTINQYTITFDTDGGSAVKSITQDYGTAITAPAAPTKTGYTFTGWDMEIPKTMPAGDMTIKAQWKINQYTITFNTDGGSEIAPITQDYGTEITAPANPTKTGYTFDGWDAEIPTTMPAGDMTIKAKWTINQYTVTFKNGDEVVKSAEMNYGSTITAPERPTKEGYTFKGWQGYTDNMTLPAHDVTFKAQWTINKYTLTFKNGETVYKTITQDYGTAIAKPTDPTKTGYTFAGWDENIPANMPAENVTITAKWTANQYTVTFDSDGGSACESKTVTYDQPYGALPKPTKEGYTFTGWYDNNTLIYDTTLYRTAGDKKLTAHWGIVSYTITYSVDNKILENVNDTREFGARLDKLYTYTKTGYTVSKWTQSNGSQPPATMPARQVYLYATTTPISYTISYQLNGGTNAESNPASYTVESGEIKLAAPSREGYTFRGWKSGTTTEMAPVIAVGSIGSRSYEAVWQVNSHTLKYVLDGKETTRTVNYGETVTVTPPDAKTGYTFSGWKLEGATAKNGQFTMPDNDVTITGGYTANTYTVKFNANGGNECEDITVTYDGKYTDLPTTTRTGYTFDGWYDGSTKVTADTDVKITADQTLTARWTANTYTVKFDSDGGSACKEITVTYDGKYPTLPAPTKEGYTFEGWFDGETQVMSGTAVTITEDQTLTARWGINTYTITYQVDGQTVKTESVTYGEDIPAYTYTKTGYDVSAWNSVVPKKMPARNLTFTATTKVHQHSLTYMLDGEMKSQAPVNYGTAVAVQADPTKTGYTFSGWKVSGAKPVDGKFTMPDNDVTITGSFSANTYTVTFNANGGEGSMADQSFTYDEKQALAANGFTRTGWRFTGWKLGNTTYTDGQAVSNLTVEANGTVTLEAQWEHILYTLKFVVDKSGNVYHTEQKYYGDAITPPEAPEKAGYRFDGWDREIPATMPDGDLTITAKWSSYLDLLIAMGDDFAGEKLGIARGYYQKMNGDQRGEYQSENEGLYNAFVTAVTNASVAALEKNVAGAVVPTNEKLLIEGKQIAELTLNGYDVETRLIDEDYPAVKLTTVDFLTVLFGYGEITSVQVGDQPEVSFKDGTGGKQMELMLAVARQAGVELQDSAHTYISVLDGKSMPVMLNGKTVEGITYSVTYQLSFFNNTHKITWNANGGVGGTTTTGTYGKAITAPTVTRVGYTFAGWDKAIPETMGKTALTFTAKWTANTNTAYKVQHYYETLTDGYDVETVPMTGTTGEQTMAVVKDKAGFTAGTVAQATIAANGSTVVNIYYTRNSYTLTVDADNGTAVSKETYKFGTAIIAPAAPTKTGYTFAGWSEKIPETMPAENMTVKAQWKINQYTITFDTDGGSEVASITQDYGTTIAKPTDPTKTGYTFAGWSEKIPGRMPAEDVTVTATWKINQYTIAFDTDGGSEIAPITQDYGTAIIAPKAPTKTGYTFDGWDKTIPGTMPAENMTVKAQWKINQYTITFDTDGGSEVESITQDYGTTIAKPTDPTKTGYTFAGWSEKIPETMPAENVTVKAQWTINQYTITFNTDGGSKIDPITQNYGTEITAPAAPSKTGYTFYGWDKTIPGTMPAENMTVKAQWKINQYTITFDTDGGSEIAPITQDYGTTIAKPTDPTKTGYTFAGWYTDAACTNAWNFGSNMLADHDMTLYARWVRNAVRKATITGSVELGNRPAVGAVVELVLGNRKIAAATTDANGVYSFQTVETGLYNIVAAKDGKTRTALVNVDSAGSYTVDMIVLPGTDVSFEVRIEMPATPPAAGSEPKADVSKTTVGGLDAVADKYAESGKKVALLLTVTPKTAEEVDAAVRTAIEERSAGQKIEFVDMTLSKSVDDAPATTISSTGDRLLTINIPFATSGVSVGSMAAYRCIDGKVETLTSTPNADGEFIEVRGGVLVVHTGKPATYAIGYRLRSGSSYGGTYSLTSGDGQNGKAGATLQFGVNSGGTKVSAVYVDGTQLGGGDYTVKGTIVRLKGVYTATLAQGYHFGTVYYDNGYVANFSFTLSGETSPRTADMGIGLYAALALTSLTGMAWVGKRRGSGRES